MKIVFVVFSLRGGGAERVVSQFGNELAGSLEVSIIQLSDIDPFYQLDQRIRLVRYRGRNRGALRFVKLAHYLYKAFHRADPDVVVSFGETISPFVLLIGKLAKKRVVVANRASPLSSLRGRRGWLNPLLYRFADAVWVQTKRAVEILEQRYRRCRWMVLENPIDIPEHVPSDAERENICVMVGYLGGEKNQAALIEAFACKAPQDWSLWLVGDGPDRQSLELRTAALGLAERVCFTGAVENIFEILLQAKVFAFTSRSEGFPNALAEAMACGCACVAYDCVTGPAELIENERSGLLIPLDDEEAFATKLGQLFRNPALRKALVEKARESASRLNMQNVSNQFLTSMERVRGLQSTPHA